MQWADSGSLDDFIAARHSVVPSSPIPGGPGGGNEEIEHDTRSMRIRAFRAAQKAKLDSPPEPIYHQRNPREWAAVHLCSAEEVRSIMGDIIEGLAFLVSCLQTQEQVLTNFDA
jgi:hypothetical protein